MGGNRIIACPVTRSSFRGLCEGEVGNALVSHREQTSHLKELVTILEGKVASAGPDILMFGYKADC